MARVTREEFVVMKRLLDDRTAKFEEYARLLREAQNERDLWMKRFDLLLERMPANPQPWRKP